MIETKIKPMPYQKWMEFAIDNYNIVKAQKDMMKAE